MASWGMQRDRVQPHRDRFQNARVRHLQWRRPMLVEWLRLPLRDRQPKAEQALVTAAQAAAAEGALVSAAVAALAGSRHRAEVSEALPQIERAPPFR